MWIMSMKANKANRKKRKVLKINIIKISKNDLTEEGMKGSEIQS